jgi:hypothetical protein
MPPVPEQFSQFSEFTQASNETARRCASISLDCATQMVNLQTGAALDAMKEGAANWRAMLSRTPSVNGSANGTDFLASLSAWSNLYVQNMTRTVEVSRGLADIVVKAQSEFAKAIDTGKPLDGGGRKS